ncbi:MAG: hypothetical protein J7L96_09665 [Bacteroidales bacterium]|nr:hypothetical protein [Bacteroidales bacterium]
MLLNLLIISLILISLSVIGLAFNIIFKKNGKFPVTSIGHNPEMRKRKIACAKTEELKLFDLNKKILATKEDRQISESDLSGCAGCSCGD